jgi:hypothetical protein
MPPAAGKFPGYKPVKTTGPVLPPGAPDKGPLPSKPALLPSWTEYPIDVCSIPSGYPAGIAAVAGGQIIEDFYSGNLWFYRTATKTCTIVQSSVAPDEYYYELAAAKIPSTTNYLVAVMSAEPAGLWLCTLTSLPFERCKSVSAFIPLPSSFCATTTAGSCYPVGIAFDLKGNLWFVDYYNAMEVELTKASGFSQVGATRIYCTFGTGCALVGIVIDSAGNHWVSDYSCAGNVWMNGVIVFSAGDQLWGITISSLNPAYAPHLYVAVDNYCGNYPYPFVGDATDLVILPHPYNTHIFDFMPAISTQLYFTDALGDIVWLTGEP